MLTVRRAIRSAVLPWPVGLLRLGVVVLLVGQLYATAVVQRPDLLHPGAVGSDPSNYYAAAQRLNAGHSLYGPLQPGDRAVPGYPETFPAPILSPPLIAVIWRPLALLPGAWSMDIWWLGCLLVVVAVILGFALVGKARNLVVLVAVLALGLPLAFIGTGHYPYLGFNSPVSFAALSGNVNAYLLVLFVLVWWASSRDRPWLAGSAAALATALKVGPIVLLWWFVTRRSWRSARAFVVAGIVMALIGVVFAGLQANLDFVRLALGGDVKPAALSVIGMLQRLLKVSPGIARYGTIVATVIGLVAVAVLRKHPRAAFTAAILTTIYSSPVVLSGNFVLLVAIAAPWVLPGTTEQGGPDAGRRSSDVVSTGRA